MAEPSSAVRLIADVCLCCPWRSAKRPSAEPGAQLVEGTGDSRLELFNRVNPNKRAVKALPQVDSKGHLKGMMVVSQSGHNLCEPAGEMEA